MPLKLHFFSQIYSHENKFFSKKLNLSAKAPTAPAREGYDFIGWSGNITNVSDRVFSVAQYEPKQPAHTNVVTYEDKDGGIISTEGITLHIPEAPVYDKFTFLGWLLISGDPAEGITIRATYQDNHPQSVDQTSNSSKMPLKVLREGQIYILRGDKTYTLTGSEVR